MSKLRGGQFDTFVNVQRNGGDYNISQIRIRVLKIKLKKMNMKMERIVIVIPIHKPHFEYGKRMLKTRKETMNEQMKMVIGCSTKSEMEEMREMIKENKYENIEVIQIECSHIGNKAIYKKYYMLKKMKEEYEHVVCIDAETEFKKKIPESMIIERSNNPVMLGSNVRKCKYNGKINRICAKEVGGLEGKAWTEIYFWFSDVPVYNSDCLKSFFRKYEDIEKISECYEHFEHIMYIYFVKSYYNEIKFPIENPKIINIKTEYGIEHNWSLESCSSEIMEEIVEKIVETTPMWCIPKCYEGLSTETKNKMYMCYHLDR